jgi:hypothetical protein
MKSYRQAIALSLTLLVVLSSAGIARPFIARTWSQDTCNTVQSLAWTFSLFASRINIDDIAAGHGCTPATPEIP